MKYQFWPLYNCSNNGDNSPGNNAVQRTELMITIFYYTSNSAIVTIP